MSRAGRSHTTSLPAVTSVAITFGVPMSDPRPNGALLQACDAACNAYRAMEALTTSVADLSPADPRHSAAYGAVELLQAGWRAGIEEACRQTPSCQTDWIAKARLLSLLVERDGLDRVVGGPALQLAASLADDLLHVEGRTA